MMNDERRAGSQQFVIEQSRSGEPTLRVRGADGRPVQIHSRYRPREEAARQLAAFDPGGAGVVLLFGLGLGYQADELLGRCAGRRVVVVEAQAELETAARGTEAGRRVLERCAVLFGPDATATVERLRALLAGDLGRELLIYRHPPSCQAQPAFYDEVAGGLGDFWREGAAALGGLQGWRALRRVQLARNLERYLGTPGVAPLFGRFRGATLFVVAAGPSLDRNLPLLARIGQRGLLVAVDTALLPLQQAGIAPQFVVSTDPQPANAGYLAGCAGGPVLVASPESPPALFRAGLPALVFQTAHPLLRFVGRYAPRGALDPGCCAAHAAFELGLALGAGQVVLVGLDLALSGGRDYCGRVAGGINRYRPSEQVPGYFGGMLATDPALAVARTWFERRLRDVAVPVKNGTEGGAAIGGAPPVKLRECLARLPRRGLPIERTLAEALSATPRTDRRIGRALRRLAGSLRAIERTATSRELSGEALLVRLRQLEPGFGVAAEECLPELVGCAGEPERREALLREGLARAARGWLESLERCVPSFFGDDRSAAERSPAERWAG